MTRDRLAMHQYVLFAVLLGLLLVKILMGNFVFDVSLFWWLLGVVLGFLFVFADRALYSFLAKPEAVLTIKLRELWRDRRFADGLTALLNESYEQREMIMRSFLFVVVWLVLALWTMTSVASPFARGFILGIGIHLVFDLLSDYYWSKERFEAWFWQIKREVSIQEKRWFVILVTVISVLVFLNF